MLAGINSRKDGHLRLPCHLTSTQLKRSHPFDKKRCTEKARTHMFQSSVKNCCAPRLQPLCQYELGQVGTVQTLSIGTYSMVGRGQALKAMASCARDRSVAYFCTQSWASAGVICLEVLTIGVGSNHWGESTCMKRSFKSCIILGRAMKPALALRCPHPLGCRLSMNVMLKQGC